MPEVKLDPLNLDLLILNDANKKFLLEVKSLDIFEGATKNFHTEGLFSIDIFGRYGEEKRNRTLAYMNFKVNCFHPVIYKALTDLKELYADIMNGTVYAVWDEKLSDFVKSNPVDGATGYSFFLNHFKYIKFVKNESDKRAFNIKVVEKFKDNCLMDDVLVLPAGLRDFEIDEFGKQSMDEINDFYKRILSISNLINPIVIKTNPEIIDATRFKIQMTINGLYDYLKNMIDGKKKLVLGKFASRRIRFGTRNVITSPVEVTQVLNDPYAVSFNDTVLGLFQVLKAQLPISLYSIRNGIISRIFVGANEPAVLVNAKTLKKELVNIESELFEEWMSDEGLEKTINYFGDEELRHEVLSHKKYFFALIYKTKDSFKVFQDIDELPEGLDKENVTPITFAELLYISIFTVANNYPCFNTRFPIAGYGSIFPSFTYLKTTVHAERLYMLDDNWEKTDLLASQFPIRDEPFVNSCSIHRTHLKAATADFDGDMMSNNITFTEDSKTEVNDRLGTAAFYINPNGGLYFSADTDIVKQVLKGMFY